MPSVFKISCIAFFILHMGSMAGQNNYQVQLSKTDAECDNASATLQIKTNKDNDTVRVLWSTGLADFTTVRNLPEGNYSVHVKINSKFDTTLFFTIEKIFCNVSIPRQFTPNGDGYRDLLDISRTENYPNFEFEVFNKWGQLVHSQRSAYIPWDGTWAGTNVPDGVYYFVFYYDKTNKHRLIKGDITVIR